MSLILLHTKNGLMLLCYLALLTHSSDNSFYIYIFFKPANFNTLIAKLVNCYET